MTTEFQSKGYLKDRAICYFHDFKMFVENLVDTGLRRKWPHRFQVKQRYTDRYAKSVVLKKKLAVTRWSTHSWFYGAYERKDADPLTNYTLQYIEKNVSKEGKVLVTGCGTGITAFHLADCGFKEIVGTDILPEAISIANQLKEDFRYTNTEFILDNGFDPKIPGKFNLITALHWLFSAWAGNYGNSKISNSFDVKVRDEALQQFLSRYSKLLEKDGILIMELTDAVADYRLSDDHRLGLESLQIYPIRHSPDQVERVAKLNGFDVLEKKLCVSYGHQPRTSYYLKKN